MIEVEKKFTLTPQSQTVLLMGAELIGTKTFTDTYYDTLGWTLTKKDRWLRQRGEVFELKVPLHTSAERQADQYDELTDEAKIREAIGLKKVGSFAEDLVMGGYKPCCVLTTQRTKYRVNEFSIDIDKVTGKDFAYQLAEIELMVDIPEQMNDAIARIMKFAKDRMLETGYVRGKVLEFLKQKRPQHFQALVDAGVVTHLD